MKTDLEMTKKCDKCGVIYDIEAGHYCDPADEPNEIEIKVKNG